MNVFIARLLVVGAYFRSSKMGYLDYASLTYATKNRTYRSFASILIESLKSNKRYSWGI